MEKLFESFIAEFIRRHRVELGLAEHRLHIQSAGKRKWLLESSPRKGKFRLKPDIVLGGVNENHLIVDTKWKHLKSDREDTKNGVSQADLYQLFAYAHRYECPDSVLLYPKVQGVTAKSYRIPDVHPDKHIRVEFVDLNRDLRRQKDALIEDLRTILNRPVSVGVLR